MVQIKNHKDRKIKKSKAKACLFTAVSSSIFTRIISLKSAKAIWDYLNVEYEGGEQIKGMQVLNLIRHFELQRMKESESIKDYIDRLLSIANRVRMLGSEFTDSRIDEKILVTVPVRFEATITTLENTKELSKITLVELLNTLQAQEQRRIMRKDGIAEGNSEGNYPPCKHCGKKGHPPYKCWERPDARCSKCNQLGHEAVICKSKNQQQEAEA
ncbi:uncharacterized protein LOC111398194 [Olea europaea var. sylvestris]|uniref:uncharacterized protein LOC111398194 n=1 Tax=Olea europaea var. sylvestris TaxID=158386 RepID=UPI000C1CE553|nr:uncharacterized protein LOC111398194 [Olea europaea var. sylvestris]